MIVLTLVMGLVFGGLRVAAAADSAARFGRVSQLANLGQQVTGLVQALEDERDETSGDITGRQSPDLQRWYDATDAAVAKVQALAAGVGGSFPANIQAKAATVRSAITNLGELRSTAQASQSALAVIADYAIPIGDMISLNDQIAQGTLTPASSTTSRRSTRCPWRRTRPPSSAQSSTTHLRRGFSLTASSRR